MPPNGVSILQQACLFLPHSQCPVGWACTQSASIQSQHLEYYFRKNTWVSLAEEGGAGMGKVPPYMAAATRHSSLSPQPRHCSHPRGWGSTSSCSWEARLSFGRWSGREGGGTSWRWNPQHPWCLRTCWADSCALSLLWKRTALCLAVLYLTTNSCAPKKKHHL